MACRHKFIDYLNLDNLDFDPTTLIVGTFNPEWPDGNHAECFMAGLIIIFGMSCQEYMARKV